jgi:hypothetical protein
MLSSIAFALAATVLVSAAPAVVDKRATTTQNIDTVILNYALTLEHLEGAFYKGGLAKVSFKSIAPSYS